MTSAAALAVLAFAVPVRAHGVSDELIVSSTDTSASNPRGAVFTNSLNASFDLGDDWTLSAGLNLTLPGAATRAGFGDSSGAIALFTGGLDWFATDHLTLGATLDVAPPSTQFVGTTLTVLGRDVDAELRSRTSQLSFGLDASWDTLGLSDLEWSFDLGLTGSHYTVDQGITRPAQLSQSLQASGSLDFLRLSPGVTATLFADTDVSVLADWYLYEQDPTAFGNLGIAFVGQGAGLPIAPLRYLVRPEVLHRFGAFSAKVWAQAGQYVSGTGGTTLGLGTKLQYRFSKSFRLWLTLSGQRDVDVQNDVTFLRSASIGAAYRW